MNETNRLIVVDDNGNEIEMEIIFTFVDDSKNKQYVLYTNPAEEDGEVFASSYDDEGNLYPIEDEKEWEMVEEVFGAYIDEFEDEEA
ncbi:MAG: DUF1292 domain-containing protein [Erysipelotrichales bacterium]|nr:DUF1292 domain-containing protein [Erysipelotrichales bacterium]